MMSDMELSRRNGSAVLETLNRQDLKIAEQQQRIDGLNNALAGIMERLQRLEQDSTARRIAIMGSGPTAAT